MNAQYIANSDIQVDNIQHSILSKAIYCWKPTLDVDHPTIRHNRVELYFGSNYNTDNIDHNVVLDLLKYHLNQLHEELRSDHIFPTYGQHFFHVIGNQDKSLRLSVLFWCEKDFHHNPNVTDYRFCELINSHFEQIRRPIEEGRCNKQVVVQVG